MSFEYDDSGNLTSLTPPGKPAHLFTPDDRDREEFYFPPALPAVASRTTFEYNREDQLTKVIRADGRQVLMTYPQGRLEDVTFDRGPFGPGMIDLIYEPGTTAPTGRLEGIDAPGPESLSFTHTGPYRTGAIWSGTVNSQVRWTLDGDGRLDTQSVNGEPPLGFDYEDLDGLLTLAGALVLTPDLTTGFLASTTLGAVVTSQEPNAFGELLFDSAEFSGTEVYGNDYVVRDQIGRIVRKDETILDPSTGMNTTTVIEYGYHPQSGRLETVTIDSVLAREYDYDSNGNRTTVTDHTQGLVVTSAMFDDQDRIFEFGIVDYTQNDHGDRTTRTNTVTFEETTYVYDTLGNLIRVEERPAAGMATTRVIDYAIDGQNRRIAKWVDGVLERGWIYQDQLNPVAEILDTAVPFGVLDGADELVRFVYGSRPNVPDYMVKGGVGYRILSDHLGSPRLVVDSTTGVVRQRTDYDEFGGVTWREEYDAAGTLLAPAPAPFQPFGFAGGLWDPDTKLVRFGSRDYDPEIGRWTRKDSIRFSGGDSNLYAYVNSDPINFVDPTGEIGPLVAIGIAFVASGGVGATGVGFAFGLAAGVDPDFAAKNAQPVARATALAAGGTVLVGAGFCLASTAPAVATATSRAAAAANQAAQQAAVGAQVSAAAAQRAAQQAAAAAGASSGGEFAFGVGQGATGAFFSTPPPPAATSVQSAGQALGRLGVAALRAVGAL